jgi:fructan beta-fructosidase
MNDPNGLALVDGTYHLFFQHDPASTKHGPMHWGHARSTDLVHWEEMSIALYPDELGTCFSGSAIETSEGEVKLFYTAHQKTADDRDYQTQCLVHADRTLTRFRPDPANAIIDNPGLECFRDPKVIWHQSTERWIMAVTLGQSIGFYASTDLVNWTFESVFGEGEGRHSEHPWECPDLFPLRAPDGSEHWVLVVGIATGSLAPGSGTQYFVGQFDGYQFRNANPAQTELWLDYGRDYYAAQSFFDRTLSIPIIMAWASNWAYARQTPTEAFRGVMSLPRQLHLVQTPAGLRLSQSIPASVRDRFEDAAPNSGTYRKDIVVTLALGQTTSVRLFGEEEPHFIIERHDQTRASIRTLRRPIAGMPDFEHDYAVDLVCPSNGCLQFQFYVDRGLVELGTADGLVWITNLFFPIEPEGGLIGTGLETTV